MAPNPKKNAGTHSVKNSGTAMSVKIPSVVDNEEIPTPNAKRKDIPNAPQPNPRVIIIIGIPKNFGEAAAKNANGIINSSPKHINPNKTPLYAIIPPLLPNLSRHHSPTRESSYNCVLNPFILLQRS